MRSFHVTAALALVVTSSPVRAQAPSMAPYTITVSSLCDIVASDVIDASGNVITTWHRVRPTGLIDPGLTLDTLFDAEVTAPNSVETITGGYPVDVENWKFG